VSFYIGRVKGSLAFPNTLVSQW